MLRTLCIIDTTLVAMLPRRTEGTSLDVHRFLRNMHKEGGTSIKSPSEYDFDAKRQRVSDLRNMSHLIKPF
jgi:hypothetical protein